MDSGAWQPTQFVGSQRVGHDWATNIHIEAKIKLNTEALQFEDGSWLYFEMYTFSLYSYEIYLNKNGIVMYLLLKRAFQWIKVDLLLRIWLFFKNNQLYHSLQFSAVTQLCLTLQPHELQHARPPCPSPTPGVYSNSRPSSWWCPPAISSSVVPFSSCPQSLPSSESFPVTQLFAWGGQSTGVS